MLKKKVAVVTGGAGFIGSHTVDKLLAEDFEVRVIDNFYSGRLENLVHLSGNPNLTVNEQDIRSLNANNVVFKDADIVIHFAGIGDIVPSINSPKEYMDVNVGGTINVLEACRANSVKKLVYAASSSCYGIATVPTSENAPIQTKYPYALAKYQGEQACLHWQTVYKLPVNSIRIFNAYGVRSRTSGAYGAVFGVFLKQKLEGRPFTVVGDGKQSRDFLYVTDVADAFFRASTTKKNGIIWNLGAGKPQSINKLAGLLGGERVSIPKRPGEPDVTWADSSKIRSDLGWYPKVSFEEGVSLVLENIEYWREAPLWDQKSIEKATETWFSKMCD